MVHFPQRLVVSFRSRHWVFRGGGLLRIQYASFRCS
jgi:hypothetical protein